MSAPKLTIRDWVRTCASVSNYWTHCCPPEVMADFEKLFALPETWRQDVVGGVGGDLYRCARDLEAILGPEKK